MPLEYVARWSGGRIGAGASVFHFLSVAGPATAPTVSTAVKNLFDTVKAAIPDDVTITFDSEVRDLTNAGVLTAIYPVTAPAGVAGTSNTAFANGAGLVVRHNTGVIVGGKRIIGRTFFVPVASASFNPSGDVLASTITSFNSAFATLISATSVGGSNFAVWSRKNAAVAQVQQSQTQSRPSALRTRNDRL